MKKSEHLQLLKYIKETRLKTLKLVKDALEKSIEENGAPEQRNLFIQEGLAVSTDQCVVLLTAIYELLIEKETTQ